MALMKEDIEVGDVVFLASGGPAMTVARIGEERIECVWFRPTHDLPIAEMFRPVLLTKEDPAKLSR